MWTPKELKTRIIERNKIRAEIAGRDHKESVFLLISETLDDYLEQKQQSDKVIEGILKDINNGIDGIRAG